VPSSLPYEGTCYYRKIASHREKGGFLLSTKEIQQDIIANMRDWQKVENASIASTSRIIEDTENPVVRLVMEVIQRDSHMHYRVQDLVAGSLESRAITLSPEELGKVWTAIEEHIALEKKTIELAKKALGLLKGRKMVVQEYLLHYLLMDEEKHTSILEQLGTIKKGMYPYG
jgi:hypothetical protein